MVSVLSRTILWSALSLFAVPGWAAAQPAPDAPAPGADDTAPAPADATAAPAPEADAAATQPSGAAAQPAPQPPATTAAPTTPQAAPAAAPTAQVNSVDNAAAQGEKNEKKKNKKKKDKKKKPWKRKPKVRVRGRVFALYMMRDRYNRDDWNPPRNDVPLHEFRVSTARVGLGWSHGKLIDGEVSLEATAEADDSQDGWAPLRDAYVRIKPMRELKFRIGQFKKPFSRLELTSRSRLSLVERGISHEWIIEELGYGDRDIGLQLEGRFGKKKDLPRIEYQVGVFNGAGRNYREEDLDGSMDLAGRVEVDPTDWLSLGLNASHKTFDTSTYEINTPAMVPKTATAGGADFLLELERLRVHGEALLARDHFLHEYDMVQYEARNSLGALLLVSYKHRFAKKWRLAIEPLAKGELFDPDTSLADSHILSATVGANLHIGRSLRLMLQADRTRTSRNLDHEEYRPPFRRSDDVNLPADEDRLLFQVAFVTK